jgi:flagellar FliL protein
LFASGANAEGSKEGESLYHKLEPFTVNLVGLTQVVQVVVTLKLAKPEMDPKVSLYLPAIRHEVILLLSSKSAEDIQSIEGKKKLIAETKTAVNKALGTKPQEGVSEVLFESIIIQ